MAVRNIKTRLSIDGEKEYKAAISEINGGLSVLNSEMKKVTAQYQDNANSVEALTAKNDVLEKKLLSQKEKVEKLKEALAKSVEQYGEADSRTMKWQSSLNSAEAAVYDTEAAIKANNEAMKQASQEGEGLGSVLNSITQKFGVSLPEGITTSLNSVSGFSSKAVVAIGAVSAAVVALTETYKGLIDMTVESAAGADNVLTLSQITGLDTDTIQEMQYASELIDVSFETIKGSLTRLKKSMDSAKDGNKELTDTFRNLGVAIEDSDGSLRNVEDVFYDVIDSLGNIGNATERDTVAMEVFGKKAEDLNPLIIQGGETLAGYAEEAHNVGYVLTEEGLSALGAVDDAVQRLNTSQKAITDQMSAVMSPAVEKLYTTWTDLMLKTGEALVKSGLIQNMATILTLISKVLNAVISFEEEVPILTTVLNGLSGILGAVAQFCSLIADAADLIKSIFTLDFAGVANALGFGYSSGNANNYQRTYMMQEGTWDQYAEYYGITNASGTQNFSGGMTWVGEKGPELVSLPQGSQIMTAQESRSFGGDTFQITMNIQNVKDLETIVTMAKQARVNSRMGAIA